jgi:hypothetical protein
MATLQWSDIYQSRRHSTSRLSSIYFLYPPLFAKVCHCFAIDPRVLRIGYIYIGYLICVHHNQSICTMFLLNSLLLLLCSAASRINAQIERPIAPRGILQDLTSRNTYEPDPTACDEAVCLDQKLLPLRWSKLTFLLSVCRHCITSSSFSIPWKDRQFRFLGHQAV